jgi:molecular chaperone DnaK
MKVDRPVGIDLGTTNSEIALLHPAESQVLLYEDKFGRKTFPSALAWDEKADGGKGAMLVGHPARARRGKDPGPIESIKRKMGQRTTVTVGPHQLSPEEVSSRILSALRTSMVDFMAQRTTEGVTMTVTRAVITVPAYFDAPQVEATRKAGELAGLDVLGILQEPTAAAIYHTWKEKLGDGNFLVYDLGGGTFDVSVLRCLGGEYQVLAIDGDNFLGGDDLDRAFAMWLRAELEKGGYALDLQIREDADDAFRFSRLRNLAQEIKESLATKDVVSVSKQDFMTDKNGESVSFEREIGRADYEAVVSSLVETTIACAERALGKSQESASVGIADIDHIVLVGGSTRVPLVVRRVTEALANKAKNKTILQDEVDTCVALGAAVHAAQLGGLTLTLDESAGSPSATLRGPLVGQGKSLRLAVTVNAPSGVKQVEVRAEDKAVARGAVEDGVAKLEVPLGAEQENRMELSLVADGKQLGALPFALYRGDARPRASALSRPSVVAKDIAIEVTRAGRIDRRILIPEGTGLPTSALHTLYTGDQSGAVVLRLLQNRLPIKTLVLEVSKDTPVGTPVSLMLTCDESMRIEAKAEILGQTLWAKVDRPELTRFESQDSVDSLLSEADSAGRAMWGSYGDYYRVESGKLRAGISEVINTDPDKLEALCQRLRLLIDELRGRGDSDLSPPYERFEETVNALKMVIYRAPDPLGSMSREAWESRVRTLEEKATAAFHEGDASGWRRSCNEAQALLETAHQQEVSGRKPDDPEYLLRRIQTAQKRAGRASRDLADVVPSAAPEVRALQQAEQARIGTWLNEKVTPRIEGLQVPAEGSAVALRQSLDDLNAELHRIELAIERLPNIGLVTEAAGGRKA